MTSVRTAASQSSPSLLEGAGQIALLDNTKSLDERDEDNVFSTANPGHLEREQTHLSQRLNRASLRQELTRRKYNRYQEDRYAESPRPGLSQRTSTARSKKSATGSTTPEEQDLTASDASASGEAREGRIRRSGRKVRGLLSRKKKLTAVDGDVEIDVLYENQRGAFFFGTPLFSSQSLLNFDPSAWLNALGKPSSVNIHNAQVPDPSWGWDWTTWYVDMSQDVDEQGWQYSFMFQNKFPWHGTHPWFHSFVRRRRWLRKRVRNHRADVRGRKGGVKDAHKLNADYFTIHPAASRSPSMTPSGVTPATSTNQFRTVPEDDEEGDDVDNIGALMRKLKVAKVDREKTSLVLRFIEQGGQDLYYLADEMPHILSLLLYQYSRRRLLASMMYKFEATSKDQKEHDGKDQSEFADEKQKMDNLLKAVEAADKQIQQLEFWSDIQDAVANGESVGAVEESSGWDHGWQGLDKSGPGNSTSSGFTDGYSKEKDHDERVEKTRQDKGKERFESS